MMNEEFVRDICRSRGFVSAGVCLLPDWMRFSMINLIPKAIHPAIFRL